MGQQADFIAAHNAPFDFQVITKYFPPAELKPWICSSFDLDWERIITEKFGEGTYTNQKASTLAKLYGVKEGTHLAYDDIKACLEILEESKQFLPLIKDAEVR